MKVQHPTQAWRRYPQSGFVLPSAIFLLVILAALAAYMVSLSRTAQISSTLDIQGTRAYQAARAGIEWAAWQVLRPAAPTPCFASPAGVTLGADLSGFTVSVTCASSDFNDGANTIRVYQITSTAAYGNAGEVDYVERQIQASFGR